MSTNHSLLASTWSGAIRHAFHVIAIVLLAVSELHAEPLTPEDDYRSAMHALAEGRETDARKALTRLWEKGPRTPGDWLDLAILHCSLGDISIAEQLFSKIEAEFDPPSVILEIIALQRATRCQRPNKDGEFKFKITRGYDSNANQGVSNANFSIGSGASAIELNVLPAFLPISDHYSAFYLDYRASPPSDTEGSAFIGLRVRNYDSLPRLDTGAFMVGIDKDWQLNEWRLKGATTASLTTLDGKPYLYQGQAHVSALVPSSLPIGWDLLVGGGLSHSHYPDFSRSDGSITETWAALRHQEEDTEWQFSAGLMHDNATRSRPGGNRNGVFVGFMGHFRLCFGVVGEFGWQRQRWLSDNIYATGLIDTRREQDTSLVTAAITFPISKHNYLIAELQTLKNSENISLYEYESRSFQLSWQYRM